MKLLCSVIALATASADCDGALCRRKNACTNTPGVGQVLREQDDYVVTQEDVDSWQACGDNADCTSGRGWNFECACADGYLDFAPESYRKMGACVYDSCMDTDCQDNSSCSVSADGAASCTCDDDFYFESVEEFNEGGNSTGFADTCYFDACATDPCSANTDCANDAGSAVCSCSAGFFDYAGDASNCVPDACGSSDDCSADAACTVELPDVNGTAQWSCACDDGFYGDGVDCWVDSCASDPCQADAACTNEMDDFSCACNSGFYLGADADGAEFCHGDVCANANPCDANAACANNADGSQTCTCNDGYKGDGAECTNIAGERAANILARADEFAATAEAQLVNDSRARTRVGQAMNKYTATIAYVSAWEAGCMNNADLQAAALEAADLGSDEELLGTTGTTCMTVAADHEATMAGRVEELKTIATARKILKETSGGAVGQTYSFVQLVQMSGSSLHSRVDLANAEIVNLVKKLAREQHSATLAQLASRISAVIRYGSSSGADPFVKVRGLIADMISKLEKEAQSESSEKAYCDEELAKTAAKKQELGYEISKLTAKVDKAAAKSASLKDSVKTLQKDLAALAKSQAEMDKIRREQSADYTQAKTDLELGLSGVRKALGVLRDYYGGAAAASMLQDGSDMAFTMQQPAAPVQHSKASGAGGSIVEILEVVESDFAKNLASEETQEADASAEYEKQSQENKISKSMKEQDVKYQTQEFKGLDKTISELSSDRETSNTELSAVLEYGGKLNERCIAKPETYEQRKGRRTAEIAGLKEALSILNGEALVQRKKRGYHSSFLAAHA